MSALAEGPAPAADARGPVAAAKGYAPLAARADALASRLKPPSP